MFLLKDFVIGQTRQILTQLDFSQIYFFGISLKNSQVFFSRNPTLTLILLFLGSCRIPAEVVVIPPKGYPPDPRPRAAAAGGGALHDRQPLRARAHPERRRRTLRGP